MVPLLGAIISNERRAVLRDACRVMSVPDVSCVIDTIPFNRTLFAP